MNDCQTSSMDPSGDVGNRSSIRHQAAAGLRAGDTLTVTRSFSKRDVVDFAGITRDYNPVHFDEPFSLAKGFKNPICHGLLVGSLLTEIGGQIGWLASRMDFRFRKPVFFNDTISCKLTLTKVDEGGKAEAEALFTNQDGVVVVQAFLGGIIPGEQGRDILKQMLAEGDPTNAAG